MSASSFLVSWNSATYLITRELAERPAYRPCGRDATRMADDDSTHAWPSSAPAFSEPSSLAWGDRPAPRLPACRVSAGVFTRVTCLSVIPLPSYRIHRRLLGRSNGMALYVSLIEAEGELIDVPRQMLRGDLVIDAVNSTLQDRPNRFDAVRVADAACVTRSCGCDFTESARKNKPNSNPDRQPLHP